MWYFKNNNKPLFFSGFTSTSEDIAVAEKFAQGGVIFEIKLSKRNPHPHIKLINNEWTAHMEEKETLIYPYFPFYIEKIQKEEKYHSITLVQDESQPIFSKDNSEMKNYWNKTITDVLEKETGVKLHDNIIDNILQNVDHNILDDKLYFDALTSRVLDTEKIIEKNEIELIEIKLKEEKMEKQEINIMIDVGKFSLNVLGYHYNDKIIIEIKNSIDLSSKLDEIDNALKKMEFCNLEIKLVEKNIPYIENILKNLPTIKNLRVESKFNDNFIFFKIDQKKLKNLENLAISSLNFDDFRVVLEKFISR